MFPEEIKKKPLEYIFLLLILLFGLVGFIYFSFSPHNQRRVIYLTGGAYLFWSLVHHYKRGDLTLPIIFEYLLVAIFAFILISTTLF